MNPLPIMLGFVLAFAIGVYIWLIGIGIKVMKDKFQRVIEK